MSIPSEEQVVSVKLPYSTLETNLRYVVNTLLTDDATTNIRMFNLGVYKFVSQLYNTNLMTTYVDIDDGANYMLYSRSGDKMLDDACENPPNISQLRSLGGLLNIACLIPANKTQFEYGYIFAKSVFAILAHI